MIYGSVCSGIEAATAAWHPMGWKPAFFSEIEKFPRAVLTHHYPDVPLHGDFTTIGKNNYDPIDLLVGGTPCQSFSVAGLRGGMADERGNLALEYIKLAQRTRPNWLVWENVPGVLSSAGGRDFGSFLGGLAQLGYGYAYRVLDAQYIRVQSHSRAVPQRRRRVIVVGYIGDWRCAAAVLFERESLRRHSPPIRKTGQEVAGTINASLGRSRGAGQDPGALTAIGIDEECNASIDHIGPLLRGGQGGTRQAVAVAPPLTGTPYGDHISREGLLVPEVYGGGKCSGPRDSAATLAAHGIRQDFEVENFVVDNCAPTLVSEGDNHSGFRDEKGLVSVAFTQNQRDELREMEVAGALAAEPGAKQQTYLRQNMTVRRLTPRECERLQGFPDDFTKIKWRGKDAENCPDGPRYKALGNSMAVPVMAWIGQRIEAVESVIKKARD